MRLIDSKRVHHHRSANGYFLVWYLAICRSEEVGSGGVRRGEQI